MNQAVSFADTYLRDQSPSIMLDDGMLALQWRGVNHGVLLVFSGDGTATYSIKRPGGQYATSGVEFQLAGEMPMDVREAIDSLENI